MKKKIFSLMAVFMLGVLIFTGCGFTPLKGGPSLDDHVSSNGSMVVQKGNYVYFVNGLEETKNLKDGSNKYGSVDYSSLYRTELDNNGKLQYDENGKLIAEVLAPKVIGFENGSFYILDDRIYYATPNTEKNASGNIDFTQTDFYSSKLDGSDVVRIYKTNVASTKFKFAFYKVENSVVLAVYDSADLFMIDCDSHKVTKVAEKVDSIVLPKVTEVSSYAGENYVYYTRSSVEEDNSIRGNILAMASLKENQEKVALKNSTYVVKLFASDGLIYSSKGVNDKGAYLYMINFKNDELDQTSIVQISDQEFKNEPLLLNFENGSYRGLIVKNESGYLTHVKPMVNHVPEFEVLNSEVSLTPLAIYGDDIYAYNTDNELYKLNYKTKALTKLTSKDNSKLNFTIYANVDFDGRYVYAFQEFTGDNDNKGYYLVRIDTISGELPEVETLGKLINKHVKTETENN